MGIESFFKKITRGPESSPEWSAVKTAAEENGLTLHLMRDKEYHARQRPMPRGGALYITGTDLYVRHEIVSPQQVLEFIDRHNERQKQQFPDVPPPTV